MAGRLDARRAAPPRGRAARSFAPRGARSRRSRRSASSSSTPSARPRARADLILRQRVDGYRAGDLDRAYPPLAGRGLPPRLRRDAAAARGLPASARDRRVAGASSASIRGSRRACSRTCSATGETHPRDLVAHVGRRSHGQRLGRRVDARPRAMLEALHYRGQAARRAARRRHQGLRASPRRRRPLARRGARAQAILRLLLDLYAPLPERDAARARAHGAATRLRRRRGARDVSRRFGARDGRRRARDRRRARSCGPPGEPPDDAGDERVRFLAPFDPVVWDRRRFAHLLGLGVPVRGVHARREAQASATTRCRSLWRERRRSAG